MNPEEMLLNRIKRLVKRRNYRIRIHAVRHMIEEGFDEANIIESITNSGRIIEDYHDDCRCLILGSFHFSNVTTSPLHVICDYSSSGLVDIITAYIPQKPWWVSPTKRGKKL